MEALVQYEVRHQVAYITLNRPEKRNALNDHFVQALRAAFAKAAEDSSAKVIVLQAVGEVFCAGADLAYLQQLQKNTFEENLADSSQLKALFEEIYTHPKVVIAQVHGHAIAGGCGLAAVCDIVFAAPKAQFGYTEVRIGFIPAIVSFFLLRKIGEARGKELLLSGELISAEQACQYGLINYVVEAEELPERVRQYAERLCQLNSAQAMQSTKILIAKVQELPLAEALHWAATQNAHARESSDCRKGIAAFLNKEKIQW